MEYSYYYKTALQLLNYAKLRYYCAHFDVFPANKTVIQLRTIRKIYHASFN